MPKSTKASSSSKNPSALASLAPLFQLLNWVAFFGWAYIVYQLIAAYVHQDDDQSKHELSVFDKVQKVALGLEGICYIEVARIIMGDLPGSTLLGVLLHAIRTLALTQVMPRTVLDPSTQWIAPTILASWSITEVARYPMYMFPSNKRLRSLRMVTPLVTFPVGVLGEAYGAYWVLFQHDDQPPKGMLLKLSLVVMLLVQGGMGPTMAYPHLLKKGLPELGW